MRALHPVQLNILRKLLFTSNSKFSDLKTDDMENSHFIFYLDKLFGEGLIVKEENRYSLTDKGKEFANRMDDKNREFKIQPKTTTVFCCTQELNGEKEFLIYKRLKNPFYGGTGFPAHKVWWGEKLENAVIDGLKTETGLDGENPELLAIRHYHAFSNQKELLEDKLMYIYLFQNPLGELKSDDEGEYFWINENEIQKILINPLPEFAEEYELIKKFKGQIDFKEIDQFTDKF
jgi:ADP-ribose pyrophosphatase YjhB (NUDIX family)